MSTDQISSAPLWDIPTAAKYLGIGQASLRKHLKLGTGPTYIPLCPSGGKIRLQKSDLDDWLENRRVSGKTIKAKSEHIKEQC